MDIKRTVMISVAGGAIAVWLAERRELVAAGRSNMNVGHVDLFATPIASR